MKEKFKQYLEEQFRHIAPTKAAMEFRKQLLVEMLDREQELRIKGISDETLLLKLVIEDLGDMPKRLEDFETGKEREANAKRKAAVISGVSAGAAAIVALIYVIIGVTTSVWHPTWLIILGSAFLGLTVLFGIISAKSIKAKKYWVFRSLVAAAIVMFVVFLFLILQLVLKIDKGSFLIFLAMVPVIVGVDTVIAFIVDSKVRWIELPIFIEALGVMLYIILGISLGYSGINIWHPGWLMCLMGVVVAIVEAIIFLIMYSKKREKVEKEAKREKYDKVDEAYWTEWDD